jgi:hypothetical protein
MAVKTLFCFYNILTQFQNFDLSHSFKLYNTINIKNYSHLYLPDLCMLKYWPESSCTWLLLHYPHMLIILLAPETHPGREIFSLWLISERCQELIVLYITNICTLLVCSICILPVTNSNIWKLAVREGCTATQNQPVQYLTTDLYYWNLTSWSQTTAQTV